MFFLLLYCFLPMDLIASMNSSLLAHTAAGAAVVLHAADAALVGIGLCSVEPCVAALLGSFHHGHSVLAGAHRLCELGLVRQRLAAGRGPCLDVVDALALVARRFVRRRLLDFIDQCGIGPRRSSTVLISFAMFVTSLWHLLFTEQEAGAAFAALYKVGCLVERQVLC